MPTESIVFAPEIDDRALSKETKQVNQQLNESTKGITPEFEGGNLDSLMPAGGGGGIEGGGGMGAGAAGGVGALASKIPKPVAGVTAAAALPIAITGAVGVGMLNAMHGASARLQTSSSLLGQAWDNVWRPMGDKLDQLFIRDPVMDLLSATQDFEEAFRSADWIVDPVAKGMVNALQGDEVGLGMNIAELSVNIQEKFPELGSSDVVGSIGWPNLTEMAIVGVIGWPAVGASLLLDYIGWPKLSEGGVAGRIGWPSLSPDLVSGSVGWPDITPGGVLGGIEWPTLTLDAVLNYLTDPSTGSGPEQNGHPGGPASEGVHRNGETTRGGVASGPEQNASGGGGGEQRFTPDSGGPARMPEVETRLDETNRRLRELKGAMSNMGIVVDGERLGRATQDARQNRLSDTDPTVN